ncbi:hypothetical protein IJ182_03275 [bacterium]|nr:hypothetical protein [bacterium]
MKKTLLTLILIGMPIAANAFYLDSSDLNPILNIGNNAAQKENSVTIPSIDLSSKKVQQPVATNALSTIAQLNNKMNETDASVQNSFLNIVSLLSSPKESQTMQSKLSSLLSDTTTTQASKSTALSQLMTAYASDLVKNKSTLSSKIMSMPANEKSNLTKALIGLTQGQADYLSLAGEYAKAAAGVTKTSQNISDVANNLRTIQENANTLKTNAQAVQNFITQVSSIAKAGGININ